MEPPKSIIPVQNQPIHILSTPIKWCTRQFQVISNVEILIKRKSYLKIAEKICLAAIALLFLPPSIMLDRLANYLDSKKIKHDSQPNPADRPVPREYQFSVSPPSQPVLEQPKPSAPVSLDSPPLLAAHPVSSPKLSVSPPPSPPLPAKPVTPKSKVASTPPLPVRPRQSPLAFTKQSELEGIASQFFAEHSFKIKKPEEYDFSYLENASDKDILTEVLKDRAGFCLGEFTDHISAKRLLVANMEHLYRQGVRHLFVEGINFLNEQHLLDLFLEYDDYSKIGDENLRKQVIAFDKRLRETNHTKDPLYYTYTVLQEAKKLKIKVYGIDCDDPKIEVDFSRTSIMSYLVRYLVDKYVEDQSKFIVWAAVGYTCRDDVAKHPSISELLECPSIFVYDDTRDGSKREVHFESTGARVKLSKDFKITLLSPLHISIKSRVVRSQNTRIEFIEELGRHVQVDITTPPHRRRPLPSDRPAASHPPRAPFTFVADEEDAARIGGFMYDSYETKEHKRS